MSSNKGNIDRINELNALLLKASNSYYSDDQEIMSNYEYDKLCEELEELQSKTNYIPETSVTENIGMDDKPNFQKVEHKKPILSLDKTKNITELKSFLGDNKGCLSWKLDGLTAVLTYNNGKLVSAVTRGNGLKGDDILAQVQCFKNVPKTISYKDELIVRGEVIMSYSEFNKINSQLDVEAQYKNPRNLASGTIHCLDLDIVKSRNIDFIAFTPMTSTNGSYRKSLLKLLSYGFQVVDTALVRANNLETYVNTFTKIAEEGYMYPVDGLVLYLDDFELQQQLGSSSHHPRYAKAFKWQDTIAKTILRGIEWNRSRIGRINPIAIFDPVELEGSIVQKASIHNLTYIENLQLGINDKIGIYKANMVIPQIAENYTNSLKDISTLIPKKCPKCGKPTKIVKENDSAFLWCTNKNCSDVLADSILLFLQYFEIKDTAIKTVQKLIDYELIKERKDLFLLKNKKEEFEKIEGLGTKTYETLIKNIENAKPTTAQFLSALGIPNIGLQTAKMICNTYSLDEILENKNDYSQLEGVGKVLSDNICNYIKDNKTEIKELKKYINFKNEKKGEQMNTFINGKRFTVTGSLNHYTNRKQLQEFIESNGGTVAGMSKSTDYLITNTPDSGSSKNKKAQEYGTKIISEEDFLRLIGA